MSEQLLRPKLENIISGHNINQDDADWLRAALAQPGDGGDVVRDSDRQLLSFYGVDTLHALVDAQEHHITKLQAKLPTEIHVTEKETSCTNGTLNTSTQQPTAAGADATPTLADSLPEPAGLGSPIGEDVFRADLPAAALITERWVVVRESSLDVGLGCDVRTGGRPELGYALIGNAATFGSEREAVSAINSAGLPVGWVVMTLSRLLPDLYTTPPASQEQAQQPNEWREMIQERFDVNHSAMPSDPREAVLKLIRDEVAMALDPACSSQAEALIQRGRDEAQKPQFIDVCVKVQGGDTHAAQGEWMGEDIGYLVCVPREWQPQVDDINVAESFTNDTKAQLVATKLATIEHATKTQAQELPDEREAFEALEKIAKWNSHDPMLGVDYGSNGVRDFYRQIARAALAAKQERKPMTEGEIMAAEKSSYVSASRPVYSTDHWGDEVTTWEPTKHFNYFVFARAIEAHHGIVEKGVEG